MPTTSGRKYIWKTSNEGNAIKKYDSIYPKKKLPQFTCPETKEKLELIILKGGKEIIRLSAKGLPEFPGERHTK